MPTDQIICAKCGRNTPADQGHVLCRPCEGYKPKSDWLETEDE